MSTVYFRVAFCTIKSVFDWSIFVYYVNLLFVYFRVLYNHSKEQNDLFANGDLGLTLPVIEELIDINNNIIKGLERQLELLQETTLDC